jgi:hypothetical protein
VQTAGAGIRPGVDDSGTRMGDDDIARRLAGERVVRVGLASDLGRCASATMLSGSKDEGVEATALGSSGARSGAWGVLGVLVLIAPVSFGPPSGFRWST